MARFREFKLFTLRSRLWMLCAVKGLGLRV